VALRAELRRASVPTCPVVCLADGPPLARRRGQARVTSGNPFSQPAPVGLGRVDTSGTSPRLANLASYR
jgi:hypothetical protein